MSEIISVTGNKAQFNEDVTFLKDINLGGDLNLNANTKITGIETLDIDGNVRITEDLDILGNLRVEGFTNLAGLSTITNTLELRTFESSTNIGAVDGFEIKTAKFIPKPFNAKDIGETLLKFQMKGFVDVNGNDPGVPSEFVGPETDDKSVFYTSVGIISSFFGINTPTPRTFLDVDGLSLIKKLAINVQGLQKLTDLDSEVSSDVGISTRTDVALNINGTTIVSAGSSIGIGTLPSQSFHTTESVRIGKQIFDSRNQDGALNAFLSKDANGITWVTQTPAFTEGIFLMDESVFVPTPAQGGIVGAGQSFQTINFVNKNSLGFGTDAFFVTAASVTENGGKGTGLATAFVGDLWGFEGSGPNASIYRMTNVGIKNATPSVELDVTGEVHVTSNVDFDANLNVDGRTDIGGILDVDGATNLNNTLSVSQDTTLSSALEVGGNSVLQGTLNVQQAVDFDSTLNVDSSTTIQSTLAVAGVSNFNNTTDSSNKNDGSVIIAGGVGIANTINIGGDANVGSAVSIGSSLSVAGGSTFNDILVSGISSFTNIEQSVNETTGSVIISGGVGIGKSLNIGGATKIKGDLELDAGLIDINDTIADPGAGKTDYRLSSVGTGVSWRPSGVQTKRTIWVSKNGLDSNSGLLEGDAKATIGGAAAIAVENDTIVVRPGVYLENNPIGLRTDVSITGQDIRLVIIQPKNPLKDVFHVRRGCLVENLNFGGSNVGVDHSGAACVAFPPPAGPDSAVAGYLEPGPATEGPSGRWRSPYIRNCTNFMTGSIGMKVDGDNATASTIGADLKSMVCDSFTQYNENGIGVSLTNDAYAQLVSIFTINTDIGIYADTGAQCDLTNSNSSFGNFGLVAVGLGSTQFTGIVTNISPAGLPIGSTPPDTDTIVCAEVRDDSSGSPIPPFTGAVRRPFDGQALFFQIN